jgi:hypothetical protein
MAASMNMAVFRLVTPRSQAETADVKEVLAVSVIRVVCAVIAHTMEAAGTSKTSVVLN